MDGYLYAAGQQEQFRVDHIDWLKGELDEEDYETTVKALEPIADEIAKLPRGAKLVYFPQSNSTEVFNNPDVEFYYDTHTYAVGVVLD